MAELVNLRQARKAAARAEREKQAAANREKFGTPKPQRQARQAEDALVAKRLSDHQRET